MTDQQVSVEAVLAAYQAEVGRLTQRAVFAEAQAAALQDQLNQQANNNTSEGNQE